MSPRAVNFPHGDPRYTDWRCGGNFVVMAVFSEDGKRVHELSSAVLEVRHDESIVGDTLDPRIGLGGREVKMAGGFIAREWNVRHHPWLKTVYRRVDGDEGVAHFTLHEEWDYQRLPDCLAAIVLDASSCAFGPSDGYKEGWSCSVDDLTEHGKRLYDALDSLYPGCVRLLTFWDT